MARPAQKSHALPIMANVTRLLRALCLFVYSDVKVMVLPPAIIGILQASTGSLLTTNSTPDRRVILGQAPRVFLWNMLSLLVFNLANQRLPGGVAEDKINKPWRPVPSGLVTADEARRLLLLVLPCGYVVSFMWTGGTLEFLGMAAMTWLYNDLEGGSKSILYRHCLNAGAFVLHVYASTVIAASRASPMLRAIRPAEEHAASVGLAPLTLRWLIVEACVIGTTIHAMDLPDMQGDGVLNKQTLPLVAGEVTSRVLLAGFVSAWSILCLVFWEMLSIDRVVPSGLVLLALAAVVVYRTLRYRSVDEDKRTYNFWCAWMMVVYALPWLSPFVADRQKIGGQGPFL